MYGGSSGCYGMIIYNTNIDGDNAVYGYYAGDEMIFETGTLEELKAMKRVQEETAEGKGKGTVKIMGIGLLAYLAAVVLGFVFLPLRMSISVLLFSVLAYAPTMVIILANAGLYEDEDLRNSFRRFHGCEHSVITLLTKKKECDVETIKGGRIYDPECGTAYSGYAVFLALLLAGSVCMDIGFLKTIGVLVLAAVMILIMIIFSKINPFTVFQRAVVLRPTDRECELGAEIVKKLKELENGKVLL